MTRPARVGPRVFIETFQCHRIPGYAALVWYWRGVERALFYAAFGQRADDAEQEARTYAAMLRRYGEDGIA